MFVCPDEQPLYVRWWCFSIDFWWMRWAAFSCWCVVLFFFSSFFSPFWFGHWHFCSVVIWGKSPIMCSSWTLFPFVPVTGSFHLVCAKLLMCVSVCVSWLEFLFWSVNSEGSTSCLDCDGVVVCLVVLPACCGFFLVFTSSFFWMLWKSWWYCIHDSRELNARQKEAQQIFFGMPTSGIRMWKFLAVVQQQH